MANARDQRIADQANKPIPEKCIAHGCPMPWSVALDSRRCCSVHAWAEPVEWPRLTAWLIAQQKQAEDAEADAAHGRQFAPPRAFVDLSAIRERLPAMNVGQATGRAWAYHLRERELAGDKGLTKAQRDLWRAVISREQL